MQNYVTKRVLFRVLAASTAASIFFKLFVTFNNTNKSKFTVDEFTVNKNHKLISVQLITRHGARTPLHLIPGIEEASYSPDILKPYVTANVKIKGVGNSEIKSEISFYDQINLKNVLKGGASAGMLTNVGEQQMFDLGRRLKEKYVDYLKFLSPTYNTDEIYTRSTHFMRTIRSAKSVLAGMFNKEPTDTAEFLIHVCSNEEDWTFPNALNCALFSQIAKNSHKLLIEDPPTEFMKHLNELKDHFGQRAANLSYTQFRDDIVARQVHGLFVPNDILRKGLVDKADRLAGMEMASVFEHDARLACGLFIHLIMRNLNKAIERDQQHPDKEHAHKFIYYSAHDSSIGALLVALNKDNKHKMDYHWPPFAANLIIELWKNEEDKLKPHYYIRVLYMEKPLALSQCSDKSSNDKAKCDFKKFMDLLDKTHIDETEHKRICNSTQ